MRQIHDEHAIPRNAKPTIAPAETYRLHLLEKITANTRKEPNRFDRIQRWCRRNPFRTVLFFVLLAAVYRLLRRLPQGLTLGLKPTRCGDAGN